MALHHVSVSILGAGTPMGGDDGVGERIAAALESLAMPGAVRVRQIGTETRLVWEELDFCRRLLVIDSCRFGSLPGSCFIQPLARTRAPGQNTPLVLHGVDLSGLHMAASRSGSGLEGAWLMGVQVGRTTRGDRLSPEIETALPGLVARAHHAACELHFGREPGSLPS